MKERFALSHSPSAIRLVLVILLFLPLTPSASAMPLTGFIEGTAANGWQGSFAYNSRMAAS
jgi:hypothetical protein